jgi:hypothetical protein
MTPCEVVDHTDLRVDREAECAQELERLVVAGELGPAHHLTQLVAPEREPAPAVIDESFWRRLPAPALRGFTGTGSGLRPASTRGGSPPSFSAFNRSNASSGRYTSPRTSSTSGGPAVASAFGMDGDRGHVGGDVLADATVAAGGGLHEHAALVPQAHRQPVDLQLAHVAAPRSPPRPAVPPARPTPPARRRPSRCRGWSSAPGASTGANAVLSTPAPTCWVGDDSSTSSGCSASRTASSRTSWSYSDVADFWRVLGVVALVVVGDL